jgi:hypothetical protein
MKVEPVERPGARHCHHRGAGDIGAAMGGSFAGPRERSRADLAGDGAIRWEGSACIKSRGESGTRSHEGLSGWGGLAAEGGGTVARSAV